MNALQTRKTTLLAAASVLLTALAASAIVACGGSGEATIPDPTPGPGDTAVKPDGTATKTTDTATTDVAANTDDRAPKGDLAASSDKADSGGSGMGSGISGGKQGSKAAASAAWTAPTTDKPGQHAPTALTPVAPPPRPAHLTYLDWNNQGQILAGYATGHIVVYDALKNTATSTPASPDALPIIAIDPTAQLAMTRSKPGQLLRSRDQKVVLRMNKVEAVESATFSADGYSFLVAEPTGALHVWNRGQELPSLPDESVPRFLERQTADFTAQFPSIRGPILTTPNNRLIFGSAEGEIFWWNTENFKEIEQIFAVKAPVRSLAVVPPFVAATSTAGDLKVGNQQTGSYLRWSKDARADYVTGTPNLPDRLLTLTGHTLSLITIDKGTALWTATLPQGEPCGLSLSPGGKVVAVCVNEVVSLVSLDGPKLAGSFGVGVDGGVVK